MARPDGRHPPSFTSRYHLLRNNSLFAHEVDRKNRLHRLSRQGLKEKFCSFLLDLFLLFYIYTLLWEEDPTDRERKLEKASPHHQILLSISFFFFFVPLPVADRSLRPSLFIEHDIFIHSSKPILRRLGHIPL